MLKIFKVSVRQVDDSIIIWKFKATSQYDADLLAGWKVLYQYQGAI